MLGHVREGLRSEVTLEITALASWCQSDDWISGLPVNQAVPMIFRMGPGEEFNGSNFHEKLCRGSIGLATDELPREIARGRRLFLFHPRPWTEDAYRGALQIARRWH